MSLLRRLERRAADPTQAWGDSSIPPPGVLSTTAGGVPMNEDGALQIIAVMTCVGIITDAVSTLPIDTFRKDLTGRHEVPAPPLISQPFAELTQQAWFAQATLSLALRGNFYGLIISRDRLGYPTQIMPLHPDRVRKARNPSTGSVECRINGTLVNADDVFHIPNLMVPGAVVGMNPIEYARHGLGLTRAAEMYGSRYFDNSANPEGAIEVPGDLKDDETLALARAWKNAHQGIGNSHLPAVLTGGAKFNAISVNPQDSQFLETRKFQRSEIASLFRVPPHLMGDVDRTTSWGTGIEQQERAFVTFTIGGYLQRFEQALTPCIPRSQYVKFNLKGRLRGDTLQRFQSYTFARNGGWMNVDEIRALEDQEPLPDGAGQDYLQPLNMVPLGSFPSAPPPTGSTDG